MSSREDRRNSRGSQVTTTTDDGSSAFVTPLATPSNLSNQHSSELDFDDSLGYTRQRAGQDDDAVSERSGTVTPKQEQIEAAGGRPRPISGITKHVPTDVFSGGEQQLPISDGEPIRRNKEEEEHRQEREIRNLLVHTPEPPSAAAGCQVVEPSPAGTDEKSAHRDIAGEGTADEGYTGIAVTTAHSKENIQEETRLSHEALKRSQSHVSASLGYPTGLTTGIATGAMEQSSLKENDATEENQYPGGTKLALITIGLALATFVVALDNTIIATAIPQITTVFDSLNDVGWYGSAYLLTTISLQPSFGKVYTYFNIKWTYLTALVLFEVGSIICAAAVNSTMLIVGRAVAGCGAAALFSGAMTIIGYTVPLHRRAIFIAMLSSMFGISSVIGPLLGGVFTDKLSWRWCFWINLPFGGVALATVAIFFVNPKRKGTDLTLAQKIDQMDLFGALFLICGIVCLLLALQWGGTTYAWSDSKVWGCLLGFALLIIVFVAMQFWRGDKATIPPRIISQRTVAACCMFSAFLAMALYAHIYYLPFYFQAVQGTSAEGSGIRTIPYLVSNTIASVIIGASITKVGYYNPWLFFGSLMFTVGAGLLCTLQVGDYAGKWIGYQLIAGIGAGSCIQIPFIAVQVALPPKDMPTGNALAIFFNTLGGALSVSIAQNIFSNSLVQELETRAPQLNPATIVAAGATHVRDVTPPQFLLPVLEAYDSAITKAFILSIALGGVAFFTSALFEWKGLKGKKLDMGGGA